MTYEIGRALKMVYPVCRIFVYITIPYCYRNHKGDTLFAAAIFICPYFNYLLLLQTVNTTYRHVEVPVRFSICGSLTKALSSLWKSGPSRPLPQLRGHPYFIKQERFDEIN
jgi:hypothetical protein